jgi:tripartite-type tricarboxylate transporter receptor subunit TctC
LPTLAIRSETCEAHRCKERLMKRREVLALGLSAALGGLAPRHALAQAKYPDRPIKLIVPFVPGGVNDTVARLWADRVKTSLGSVYIENQGGAGGAVGGAAVARAAPDGYTILLGGAGTQVLNPIAMSRPPTIRSRISRRSRSSPSAR